MKRYYYNKLVRDKIPEIIKSRGGGFEAKLIPEKATLLLLKKKLVEESKEVLDAKKMEILGELADVLQILKSISNLEGFKLSQVESEAKKKERTNGAYKKRMFLIWSDRPKGFGDKSKIKK